MDKSKILIVEDEFLIAKNIERCLLKNGYCVSSICASGEEALDKADKEKPDLILMDIHLDGEMDGIETSGELNINFNIPIIFLTAHSNRETFNKAKVTAPFGYITKPFDEQRLCMAIEIAIYKDKSEKEKEKLRKELKILKGMLPICCHCKKIRDDVGYWEEIERYISKHSEADFSHGICPECATKYYSDYICIDDKRS